MLSPGGGRGVRFVRVLSLNLWRRSVSLWTPCFCRTGVCWTKFSAESTRLTLPGFLVQLTYLPRNQRTAGWCAASLLLSWPF